MCPPTLRSPPAAGALKPIGTASARRMATAFAVFWGEAKLDAEKPRAMVIADDPECHGDIIVRCNGVDIAHVSATGELHPLAELFALDVPR